MSEAAVRPARTEAGAAVPRPGPARRATLALARVEAVRLLRHPLVLVALALVVGLQVRSAFAGEPFPVLQEADHGTQVPMLLLGGAALVAANLAALRPHRHGTAPIYDVLVLAPWRRTLAYLLAPVPLALFGAVLVGVRIAVLAGAPGAAGRPNPAELVTGPVVILLFGTVGVLLGRLVTSAVVAPLLLVVVAAVTVFGAVPDVLGSSPLRWFAPVVLRDETTAPLPVDLVGRPAGAHLAYLAGLVVLVAVAAVLRTGRRGAGVLAAGGVSLLLVVVAGAAQLSAPSRAVVDGRIAATQHPAASQICQTRDGRTYCAFPDFASRIPAWDEVVRGVLRRVPAAVADRSPAVRQRVLAAGGPPGGSGVVPLAPVAAWQRDDRDAGTPGALPVSTAWGDGVPEVELAGQVAYTAVTGKAGGPAVDTVCHAQGAVVLWLAGQATPRTRAGLDELLRSSTGGVVLTVARFGTGLAFTPREIAVASALLTRPDDEVARTLAGSWAELTAPATSTERAAELLGTPVPPGSDEEFGRC
jgi:hypothetical protein